MGEAIAGVSQESRQAPHASEPVLAGLRIGIYRFSLVARTSIVLPLFKGSTFHGAFGHALRRLSPGDYSALYEPRFRVGSDYANRGKEPPKAFVLVPPLEPTTLYEPGSEIVFDLVLFGEANDRLAICAAAFRELGRTEFGKDKNGRYEVRRIEALQPAKSPRILYAQGAESRMEPAVTTGADWVMASDAAQTDTVSIEFVTQARFKHHGKLVGKRVDGTLPFPVFARRLLERLDMLADVHEGRRLFKNEELGALIKEAAAVEVREYDLEWRDWSRFSGRQQEWMEFGGLLGRITYAGPLGPYFPYLALGQWAHVGNKTSFGLGRYQVITLSKS